jgi:tetratricopeptide (TPR) repeat protein
MNFSALKFRAGLAIFAALFAAALPACAQEEGKRVALIIGNNNYIASPLRNAINDARLMDKALQAAGFKTILKEDATLPAIEEAAAKLAEQLGPDDTALFFYAGHGVQIEGENYLVPVDFEPTSTIIQAKFKCFKIGQLFEELKKRTKRSIVILDACRSNPVSESHGLQAGLAQPQVAGSQTYVAFSTSPGQVAADNPAGRDSYFTEALADEMMQPGLTLDDVFTRVKSRVSTATESRQSPWTLSSLTSTFYFHPPSNLQAVNDPSVAEKWMLDAQRREQRAEWDEAISLVNQVIKRKPGGVLEATANAKLPYLTLRKEAQVKYDEADYKDAATLYEKTLSLDPFAIDAAFDAVNDYLLSDQLADAVRLLSIIRVRGTSASVERADAMLKELGPVYPEADRVIKAALPKPPMYRNCLAVCNSACRIGVRA